MWSYLNLIPGKRRNFYFKSPQTGLWFSIKKKKKWYNKFKLFYFITHIWLEYPNFPPFFFILSLAFSHTLSSALNAHRSIKDYMDNFAAQGEALLSVSLQLSSLQSLNTFSSPVPHPPRFLVVCFRVSASHRSFSFTPRRPLEAGRSAWTVYFFFFPFCFFGGRQLRSRPH